MSNQPQPGSSGRLEAAAASLLVKSHPVADNAVPVRGPNFDQPLDLNALLGAYEPIGFQATNLGRAINIVNKMRTWRLSDEPLTEDESPDYTSPEHKHVSAIVTTAGGIEEDFIKCLSPSYLGDFHLDGAELRRKGMNRIGNLIVPNDNYCKFEDWLTPILDKLLEEQNATGEVWTPSKVIRRLGKEINHEESVYYWAYKNNIPVFCPALTDGSLGDMIYFHSYRNPGLTIDIVRDIRALGDLALNARKAGMIILGGGICKHQIANAMLLRNGADFSVFINTGQEFDGSDSGAHPDEAVSWGKIRADAESVKVFADATLVFPLLIAATYGRTHWEQPNIA
ncbi:hypothetical protein RSAG8_01615, partial [Rhizoctonia solani AG-8 WAC10335]